MIWINLGKKVGKLSLLVLLVVTSSCNKDGLEIPLPDLPDLPEVNNQPNILLIIADDIGIEATPGYEIGAIKPNMPTLQKMVDEGIVFNNVWSYPLCSPTRASILTGRYGYRTGVLNVQEQGTIQETEKSLQAYLDETTNKAYAHAVIGKWHLSRDANTATNMGIGHYAGFLSGSLSDYFSWDLTTNGQSTAYEGYCTTKFTDMAIDWINAQDQPWFCWLAYTSPHSPLHLPPNEMHSQQGLSDDAASIEANPLPYFMAMVESIDYEMDRLFKAIPQDELDNTIIIFLGDNGTSRNVIQEPYRPRHSKGSLYQGGIHVPMIISGKGVTRNREVENSLINTTDLFATIAEIAGANIQSYEDSYSFEPTFTSASSGTRSINYSEASTETTAGYTIRDSDYKLIVFDDGEEEFYHLATDPYESINIENRILSTEQEQAKTALVNAAAEIRQ